MNRAVGLGLALCFAFPAVSDVRASVAVGEPVSRLAIVGMTERSARGGSIQDQGRASTGDAKVATSGAPGIFEWLAEVEAGLRALLDSDALPGEWTGRVLRLYLDHYEPLEAWYGPGGPHSVADVADAVALGERQFHVLLAARDTESMRREAAALLVHLATIRRAAESGGVARVPDPSRREQEIAAAGANVQSGPWEARSPEIGALVVALEAARRAWEAGDAATALAGVERAYLEGIEPLEPRLPGDIVRRIESLIHLDLRPGIARGAPREDVTGRFAALSVELQRADAALAGSASFWFVAFNAFAIIVREGLEAVLLIAALLAYLKGMGAQRRERVRIWVGAASGLAATAVTWVLARTLLPLTGAGRELLEGVTALVAVAVLLYVSHWLFQKSYIHDWKAYLRDRVGRAVTTGSALAMAGLAFAAVYREGFETVLFYQVLLLDAGGGAVFAGFAPGVVLIVLIGSLVMRLGMRLPLRQLFGVTNAILLWLAFVFLGKGIYNLQEAGLFAPLPLRWLPDHPVLHQLLGFHPLLETVLAQLAFLVFIAATFVYYRTRSRAQRAPAVAGEVVRKRTPAAV